MPREVIHDNTPLPDGDGEQSTPFAIEVSWVRDLPTVQIATIDLQVDERGSREFGYFVDLNRTRINRLIQTLRRARDGAMGKDQ